MDEKQLKKIEPKLIRYALVISLPFLVVLALLLIRTNSDIIPQEIPLLVNIIALVTYYIGFILWLPNRTISNAQLFERIDTGFDMVLDDTGSMSDQIQAMHQGLLDAGIIAALQETGELRWLEEIIDAVGIFSDNDINQLLVQIRDDISREDIFASTMRMRTVLRRVFVKFEERMNIELGHYSFIRTLDEAKRRRIISSSEERYFRIFWRLSNQVAQESHDVTFDEALGTLESASRVLSRIIVRTHGRN